MLQSMVIVVFFGFKPEEILFNKFSPKLQNCLFKVKLGKSK